MTGPALYVGRLRHRRFRPTPHAFTYQLFMVLLDVDRIDDAMAVSQFTSNNRFNWASFYDVDHLGDTTQPLRTRVEANAAQVGITLPEGPIYLLTHLRYLGYTFNPISMYYCCGKQGDVEYVMAEVHNTFGDQCTYWLSDRSQLGPRVFRSQAPKVMHVSPFMPMTLDYEFVVTIPGSSLVVHMNTIAQAEPSAGPNFDATLTLERRPWEPSAIRTQLLRHPWMTAKVIGAIHWEAVRLWWKGVPGYPNPTRRADRSESRETL